MFRATRMELDHELFYAGRTEDEAFGFDGTRKGRRCKGGGGFGKGFAGLFTNASSGLRRRFMSLLEIDHLKIKIADREVLKDFSLSLKAGTVHALMGRNGSGKTSLAQALMGHPKYEILSGSAKLDGKNLLELKPEERAQAGLFLGFQYPVAVPGVSVAQFLRASFKSIRGSEIPAKEFRARVKKELQALQIPESFMTRFVNDGFSGGEKKRLETLQLRLLEPKVAILDETDSGLDIDALRVIAKNIEEMRRSDRAFLLITHYQRLLEYIRPDHVHVLANGRIVKSGGFELVKELEAKGYEAFVEAA
jgi:Fe-S cluster assembly ATP-binding protein